MEHCSFDGSYRQVVADSLLMPAAVAVLGHYVYWADVSLGKHCVLYLITTFRVFRELNQLNSDVLLCRNVFAAAGYQNYLIVNMRWLEKLICVRFQVQFMHVLVSQCSCYCLQLFSISGAKCLRIVGLQCFHPSYFTATCCGGSNCTNSRL